MACRYYTPDGRLEIGARIQDQGVTVDVADPTCCGGPDRSDTYRLADSVKHAGGFDKFRSRNASTAYFLVFGGGPHEGMSYTLSIPSGVAFDWSLGPAGAPFTYDRADFSSRAWLRTDTNHFGQYYVQEDAYLQADPGSNASEYLMYLPYRPPDHGTTDYDAWLRLPSGERFEGDTWIGASRAQGPWEFGIPRSADDDGDAPVILGTSLRWLRP